MCIYSFFIGSDISKSVIDISYIVDGEPIYLGQFLNSEEGFNDFVKALLKITDVPFCEWFICFENTGVYSKPLLNWLISKDIACKEENAMKIARSLGLRRGKNDKVDSKDISRYAFEKRDSIQATILSKPLIISLRKLLSRRDLLVRQKQSLSVSLTEQKSYIDENLYETLKQGDDILLKAYNNQIKIIEKLIQELIQSDPEVALNDQLAQSVIGIGKVTSAYIIAFTANYTTFKNARKFACYSGIAPFSNQSGTKKGKTKVSHIANKKIKSILSNCIASAITHDPEISWYYNRKVGQGKEKGIVLNAVKNKLIHRVFSVVQRQTPYVKMMRYA